MGICPVDAGAATCTQSLLKQFEIHVQGLPAQLVSLYQE